MDGWKSAAAMAIAALCACADDVAPNDSGGADGGSGGDVDDTGRGATGSGVSATSMNATNATSGDDTGMDDGRTSEPPGDATGGPGDDTASGSTGEPDACPDGIELVELGSTCVSAPIIVDAQPAYDVLSYEGVVVANDTGVTQYRSVGGQLVPASVIALPGRGQDLERIWFSPVDKEADELMALQVTVPDADRLALLSTDDTGLLITATLLETGARPMGLVSFPSSQGATSATTNADDGTLSLFTEQAPGVLAPATTLDVGGTPRDIGVIDQYLGVVDTEASTLTVLTLDGALQIDQLATYPIPQGPVAVYGAYGSDTGPALFLVVSRDADLLTLVRADDGTEWQTGEYPGGPSRVRATESWFWPDGALDFFVVGAIAMTTTSRITIGMHSLRGGGWSVDRILADFPTAQAPVALALADANDDGRGDFLTASPTSGLAAVLQQ